MTTTLTFARPSDLAACYSLDVYGYDNAWSEDTWSKCLADRQCRVLTVRLDGKVVGWVTGCQRASYFDLTKITVLEPYRRLGYCRRLVEGLGSGELRTQLRESNAVGLAVARALGFRAVGLLKNWCDGEDGIQLVRGRLA